jgi:5'-phosphate synthase pdxT subunit
MRLGVLGLQGAFLDHVPYLKGCGVDYAIVRDRGSLSQVDRLIIHGGESTVMAKFVQEFDLCDLLPDLLSDGLPVWGICAGAMLLAEQG